MSGPGTLADLRRRAAAFLSDEERALWHADAVADFHRRRNRAVERFEEDESFEALRDRAAAIKAEALERHEELLTRFEQQAVAAGAQVHYAADASSANAQIRAICKSKGARLITKSKSMTTEECGLTAALEKDGLEVIETDLGERIVQLLGEAPSHIVAPAIHLKREQVGDLFHRELGSPAGLDDPTALTGYARDHLREKFLGADIGITGANFLVAETGSLVVVENEGNILLTTSVPRVHIALVGIEKLIPEWADLGTMLRILARSANGQRITSYTTTYTGPQQDDLNPPRELHIVLLDNGRRRVLARDRGQDLLRCIRCGACLDHCPVLQRIGGHAYGWTYPGPIGAALGPLLDPERAAHLAKASTLCGACTEVCPVRIDLHRAIREARAEMVQTGKFAPAGGVGLRVGATVLARPRLYRFLSRLARWAGPFSGALLRRLGPARSWGAERALPKPARRTFHEIWSQERGR